MIRILVWNWVADFWCLYKLCFRKEEYWRQFCFDSCECMEFTIDQCIYLSEYFVRSSIKSIFNDFYSLIGKDGSRSLLYFWGLCVTCSRWPILMSVVGSWICTKPKYQVSVCHSNLLSLLPGVKLKGVKLWTTASKIDNVVDLMNCWLIEGEFSKWYFCITGSFLTHCDNLCIASVPYI